MHLIGIDPEGTYHPVEARAIAHTKSPFHLSPDHGDQSSRSYPVATFLKDCRACFLKTVPEQLTKFCLDPSFFPEKLNAAPWCSWSNEEQTTVFHDLRGALHEYVVAWEKKHLARAVVTSIGRKILETLDYAEEQRVTVLVEGEYGTGKTFITKAWCEARPGKRRYVQAPSSNDALDFFRTIARPLGVSSGLSMKVQGMRTRINEVLQSGHLTFVLDEAHYCFPQTNFREALPTKINWVMTCLTNYDVPVALVATPQFTAAQARVEKNTLWKSGQLVGRISRYVSFSESSLHEDDLASIARFHLPEGDETSIRTLVLYAMTSMKRLRGIEHSIKSARHVARLAGRERVTLDDLRHAIIDNMMPSDSAMNEALDRASASRLKGRANAPKIRVTEPEAPPVGEPSNNEGSAFDSGRVDAGLPLSTRSRDMQGAVAKGLQNKTARSHKAEPIVSALSTH
jgi:hypothetical protein